LQDGRIRETNIMPDPESVTKRLLDGATRGDAKAREALLQLFRDELRRMVAARLDPRIAGRVDPSDVVQDTLVEASGRLDKYLVERPLPYFAWLRQLAGERIIDAHRRHVGAQRRSILRERHVVGIPDKSAVELVSRLFADESSPSDRLARKERDQRIMEALASLKEKDREILVMRHLEQLGTAAIALALGISEGAVKSRLLRSVLRLRGLLEPES
jgi:RNA polymerase sigma-70 factor (ECF subfamily)